MHGKRWFFAHSIRYFIQLKKKIKFVGALQVANQKQT